MKSVQVYEGDGYEYRDRRNCRTITDIVKRLRALGVELDVDHHWIMIYGDGSDDVGKVNALHGLILNCPWSVNFEILSAMLTAFSTVKRLPIEESYGHRLTLIRLYKEVGQLLKELAEYV